MKAFCNRKYWGTCLVYLLMLSAAAFLIGQTFSTTIKTAALNQFHLHQKSFKTFAAIHFIPPMYSFANEVWYTHKLEDFDVIAEGEPQEPEVLHFWFNHYPLRFVTFSVVPRSTFFHEKAPQYIYVRSKFMNVTLKSIYRFHQSPHGFVLTRVGGDL